MQTNLPRLRAALLVALLVPAACGSSAVPSAVVSPSATTGATATPTAEATPSPSPTAVPKPTASHARGADAAGIVWLCMPGQPKNPCETALSTTVIDRKGGRTVKTLPKATDPKIDCFYVYPTVSRQKTINANLSIDPEERAAAVAQAALFSQVCRVYAPIYPQLTLASLSSGKITLANVMTAYNGARDAWLDYLANYNGGRGVVLIGHSQGAMLLAGILRLEVDANPDVRKRIVSALLMGGNVTVAKGGATGGDFQNLPACASKTETGCVVAYSSFTGTPPKGAAFGRVGGALGMLQFASGGERQIMCVNPAAPGGKSTLLPYFPTAALAGQAGAPNPKPATTFVSYPDELSAECRTSGEATWLQVTRIGPRGGTPELKGSSGPGWGLHELDVSLALGNLVELVRSESAAYSG